MIRPFASVAALLVTQALAARDTIVTIQTPIQPGWFERTTSILDAVMTLSFIILTVAVVPAAWNFRQSYKKVNDMMDRVYADINPITHHASRIADNVDYMTTSIRADVQKASATVADVNARLLVAMQAAEERVREFNALLSVVQEEAESTFVSTASTVRGVREGAAAFRDQAAAEMRGEPGPLDADALYDEDEGEDDDLYGMHALRDTDEEDADGHERRSEHGAHRPRVRPRFDPYAGE